MTINLTPEQERRIQAVTRRGAYESVEEVVDAALTAVEQLTVPGFAGTQQELDTLLAGGLASKQLAEDEFWSAVGKQTDAMLAEHKTSPRSRRFCIGKLPAMMRVSMQDATLQGDPGATSERCAGRHPGSERRPPEDLS